MKAYFAGLISAVLGVGGLTSVGQHESAKGPAKIIAERDIVEKVDGKESKATTVELTLEPGQASSPHRHPGPVIGYVLEGEYEWAINDQPSKKLKAGDTFYEPTMSLHRVSRNPSDKGKTRVLAVLLLPREGKQISIPEK